MNRLFGGSAFLRVSCRKLATKLDGSIQELEARLVKVEAQLKIAEAEKNALSEKVDNMEGKTEQVRERVVGMEKEIETGMEQAKKEVKEEITTEQTRIERNAANIAVYGIKESKKTEIEERNREDKTKIEELAEAIGVGLECGIEIEHRAGRKTEENAAKPLPLIVKINDEETRERLLKNARRLARNDEWKNVYISPDLTFKQREEARKEEKKLREEAEKRIEQAKNENKVGGKFVVIGQRGSSRRVVWWSDDGRRG